MSKYYKSEDVINAIEDKIAEYIPTLYGRYEEIPLELRMAIENLPTIEVSEEVTRPFEYFEGFEDGKASVEVSEDNEPTWEQVKECCRKRCLTIVTADMFAKITNDVPLVVSEDCISKAYLEQEIENQTMIVNDEYWRGWNNALDKVVELIEDAPSAVPTTEQSSMVGEWIISEPIESGFGTIFECSYCGEVDFQPTNYCPNCGAKMKGADNEVL